MSKDDGSGTVEARIRAARERGDFDDLPGHGKPLPDDELSGLPAEQRLEARLMRSLGEVSPEVQLVREIRATRARIEAGESPAERERLEGVLHDKLEELKGALKSSNAR